MAWGTKPGTGDLLMASGDTIVAGVVSAQTFTGGAYTYTSMSGDTVNVGSLGAFDLTVNSALGFDTASGIACSVNSFIIENPIVSSAAGVGSSAALPATPHGYLTLQVSGENVKFPYFKLS